MEGAWAPRGIMRRVVLSIAQGALGDLDGAYCGSLENLS
jgi:hypothetical protein